MNALRWGLVVVATLGGASAHAQCAKDIDCKGDRICEHGQCVAPRPVAPAYAAPPPVVAPPPGPPRPAAGMPQPPASSFDVQSLPMPLSMQPGALPPPAAAPPPVVPPPVVPPPFVPPPVVPPPSALPPPAPAHDSPLPPLPPPGAVAPPAAPPPLPSGPVAPPAMAPPPIPGAIAPPGDAPPPIPPSPGAIASPSPSPSPSGASSGVEATSGGVTANPPAPESGFFEWAPGFSRGFELRPLLSFVSGDRMIGFGAGVSGRVDVGWIALRRPGLWLGPRAAVGLDVNVLVESLAVANGFQQGWLVQAPLALGVQVGLGDGEGAHFSGWVLGLDVQPSLLFAALHDQVALGSTLASFQLTADRVASDDDGHRHLRGALWLDAPVDGLPVIFGVSFGARWM